MENEEVILVDQQDQAIGTLDKMEAHRQGLLHRAFSIFIFNSKGDMLLQQRALGKYHSAGLWTNACCSHPRPGEETAEAAMRRLQEEMGFTTNITHTFDFQYRAEFDNGLIEHEHDHVFTGIYDGEVPFNRSEVMATASRSMDEIAKEMELQPEKYTAWFLIAFPRLVDWYENVFENSVNK